MEEYLDHVSAAHRGKNMDPVLRYKTRCLTDRIADDYEKFDINIWPSEYGVASLKSVQDREQVSMQPFDMEPSDTKPFNMEPSDMEPFDVKQSNLEQFDVDFRPTKARQAHLSHPDHNHSADWERRAASTTTGSGPHVLPAKLAVPPRPRLPCNATGCSQTFSRAADLDWHTRNVHDQGSEYHECLSPGCPYGTRRKDKMQEHRQKVHGYARGVDRSAIDDGDATTPVSSIQDEQSFGLLAGLNIRSPGELHPHPILSDTSTETASDGVAQSTVSSGTRRQILHEGYDWEDCLSMISSRSASEVADERDITHGHPTYATVVAKSFVKSRPSTKHINTYAPDATATKANHDRENDLVTEFKKFMVRELGDMTVPHGMKFDVAATIRDFATIRRMEKGSGSGDHRTAYFMLRSGDQLACRLVGTRELQAGPVEDTRWEPEEARVSGSSFVQIYDDPRLPEIREAQAFFEADCGWLVVRARALCSAQATGKPFESIRSELCLSLQPQSPRHTFEVEWQPFEFLRIQYPSEQDVGISKVICVVGSGAQAEATTCDEYVCRTWPNVGPAIMECVESWVLSGKEWKQHNVMGQSIYFTGIIPTRPNMAQITIRAKPLVILEAGEVLCWLAAACRASQSQNPEKHHIELCFPKVASVTLEHSYIKIRTIDVDTGLGPSGSCWHDLFHRPSIAAGYPIAIRHNAEP